MKLTLETTPEQDKAIAALNQQTNSGGVVPPDDEFALSLLTGNLDAIVKQMSVQEATDTVSILQDKYDQLSDEDKATIVAITDKLKGDDALVGSGDAVVTKN